MLRYHVGGTEVTGYWVYDDFSGRESTVKDYTYKEACMLATKLNDDYICGRIRD